MSRVLSALAYLVAIIAAYAVTNEFRYGHWLRAGIALAILVLLAAAAAIWIRDLGQRRDLRRLRGIRSAGLETLSDRRLVDLWSGASAEIIAFGMGMSRLSKNEDLIRDTIRRGVRVRVILIDPDWLARQRAIVEQLSRFYDTQNIVGKNRDSYQRLCRLSDELRAEYGDGCLDVAVYRNVIMMSATIADAGSAAATGYVEFHLFHSGDKRFRLQVSSYKAVNGQRSLIEQVVKAIELAVADVKP